MLNYSWRPMTKFCPKKEKTRQISEAINSDSFFYCKTKQLYLLCFFNTAPLVEDFVD